jgi:hypothetical protein
VSDAFSKDIAIAELAKALEKMTRAEIDALAKKYGVDLTAALEGEDLRKADGLTDDELICLNHVPPTQLRDLAKRLNVDPDAPGALNELRKAAAARPFFIEAFLNEPLPPRTLGAGAAFVMSAEQVAKASHIQGQNADTLAKAVDLGEVHPAHILRAALK